RKVESNSAPIKSLIRRTVRTSCPTRMAISSIANHPILCQLNCGAAENRHEIPHHTRNASSGASRGCGSIFRSTAIFNIQSAVIVQNKYRAMNMKCGTVITKSRRQSRIAHSSPRTVIACLDALRLGGTCILVDSEVRIEELLKSRL